MREAKKQGLGQNSKPLQDAHQQTQPRSEQPTQTSAPKANTGPHFAGEVRPLPWGLPGARGPFGECEPIKSKHPSPRKGGCLLPVPTAMAGWLPLSLWPGGVAVGGRSTQLRIREGWGLKHHRLHPTHQPLRFSDLKDHLYVNVP